MDIYLTVLTLQVNFVAVELAIAVAALQDRSIDFVDVFLEECVLDLDWLVLLKELFKIIFK